MLLVLRPTIKKICPCLIDCWCWFSKILLARGAVFCEEFPVLAQLDPTGEAILHQLYYRFRGCCLNVNENGVLQPIPLTQGVFRFSQ
jgi:hypothetical protein